MWKFLPVLLLCQNVFGAKVEPKIDPLVETKLGLIRGLKSDDGNYMKFLGIPYAVVYIHGGAFIEGSGGDGMSSPKYLMPHDIIYVSINYRIGIYGFMCTDSPKAPGNVGLKDQLAALRWINEHIESFGGDDSKITIFGESAGGMSVHLHLLSRFEKLFDQAIIQSGPSTSPFTIVDRNNDVALKIAESLGFVTDDVEDAIDFISKTDVNLTIAAGAQLESISTGYSNEPLTKPCVEKEFEGIERFIEQNPNVAIPEKAKTTKVIIGICSQEMLFLHGRQTEEFYTNYSFKDLLQFGFDVTNFNDMSEALRHFYIGEETQGIEVANYITSFASDFVFNHPTQRAIDAMVEVGPKAVYHYMFSYKGDRSMDPDLNSTLRGVAHASDLAYLFDIDFIDGDISEADQLTINRLTTMWTNFAKYGDPTPEVTELLPVKWEPVTHDSEPYLDIDKDLTLLRRPFHARMAYWDLFYRI
ncbi:Uncharacterized protein OBRU01_05844 [Operophtera brumata]|uniref:Carboxylic ester hydrolase n=1 Tax=Operophtera brumata TaxID=104452 RepID=A0A0L7LMD6_OPEBR|nr:Uncharacterized protein OBRU01_05844 [Operophtera brumata]